MTKMILAMLVALPMVASAAETAAPAAAAPKAAAKQTLVAKKHGKHAKKKAGRERFQSKAIPATASATAIQAIQSAKLPWASGISEYE